MYKILDVVCTGARKNPLPNCIMDELDDAEAEAEADAKEPPSPKAEKKLPGLDLSISKCILFVVIVLSDLTKSNKLDRCLSNICFKRIYQLTVSFGSLK